MSKIIDILKAAGSAALSTIYPIKVVESIVSIVSVLADDKQDTDLTSVTGEQLKQRIETLPPELQDAILQKVLDIEALSMEQDLEMQKTLSDLDTRGKTFRPIIALMMAVIAALNTIAYSVLMYWLAWKAGKMPSNEELIIPIAVPLLLVWTYFGFLGKERKEILAFIANRTPAGVLASSVADRLNALKK